jgi:hypothetical protein
MDGAVALTARAVFVFTTLEVRRRAGAHESAELTVRHSRISSHS